MTLRVAASYGLPAFALTANPSGSTAAALDLVWTPLATQTLAPRVAGATATLERRPDSPYSCDELAKTLDFPEIESVACSEDDEMVVRLEDPAAARAFADAGGFSLGPYALEEQGETSVVLRAREPRPVGSIEIVEVPLGEQWKRLLGHQIDVIPSAAALYRGAFTGMESIRLLDYPPRSNVSLVFNTQNAALEDVCTRRAIARATDSRAIARVACGEADCAARADEVEGRGGGDCALPSELGLTLLEGWSVGRLAARVIRHEWRTVGIETRIEEVSIGDLQRAILESDYDVTLVPLPVDQAQLLYLFSEAGTAEGLNSARFRSEDLDSALASGDLDEAMEVLHRDVPAKPLFEMRAFAAVDAHFCGGTPTRAASWLWLADLHPCGEGEQP